jgi:aldose 1-epimerase
MTPVNAISLSETEFGRIDDQRIFLYTLKSGDLTLRLTNYGATIVAIETPDRNAEISNVVAGFSTLGEYEAQHPYVGSLVGRYANRIALGQFHLDGKNYQLSVNDFPNHLHGGDNGFQKKIWQPQHKVENIDQCSLTLSYLSPDGEEGYPGNLKVEVTFTVTAFKEIKILYYATTDRPTPLNLTSHSYFNLSGFSEPTIEDHLLTINSKCFLEKNEKNVPTGKVVSCEGSPNDFSEAKKIGTNLRELKWDRGYDHNHVIENFGKGIRHAATLSNTFSGRVLDIFTDMPGLQLYTANWWDGSLTGVHGIPYRQHAAVALETQYYPDSPNHKGFPNTILRLGEIFSSQTIYKFSVIK